MTRDEILNMPEGVEMDRLVVKLMGWDSIDTGLNYLPSMGVVYVSQSDGVWKFTPTVIWLWSPSTDISAAWEVVKGIKLLEYHVLLGCDNDRQWMIGEMRYGSIVHKVYADTAPLVISRAALLVTLDAR